MKNSIYKNMIDATERLPFAITQKHIDEGVADDCQRCTNAQAIKSLRTVADVRVCRTVSYVLFAEDVPKARWTRFGNGKVPKAIVKANDGKKKELIRPGLAVLDMPAASLKAIREREITLPSNRGTNATTGKPYGKTGRNSPRLAAWGAITSRDIARVVNA